MRSLCKALILGVLTVALAGCAFSLPGSGGHPQHPPAGDGSLAEHLPGTVLVRLAEGTMPEEAAAAVGGSVARIRGSLARIALPVGTSISDALAKIEGAPGVIYAEPVYVYRTPVVGSPVRSADRSLPADHAANQWAPAKIHADDVWLIPPADQDGIVVAVVDTGIDLDNPEFTGRLVGGYNAITGQESDYGDDYGHGTHVAGIIGAAHETPLPAGVRGMAGTVQLMPVKVLDAEGYACNDDIAAGVDWAADHGADLINMSLGGWGRSQVIQEAVDRANSHGAVVVVAMGNGYRYGWSQYPAACEGVIAVGATTPDGAKADFSSEGPHISLSAPGVEIFSTIWIAEAPGYSYAYWGGTSMAAPHVTGLAALLLAKDPTAKATKIRSILERTAMGGTWTQTLGHGQIDALAAYNDTGPDLYGGLTMTVLHSGNPVANAEVLVRKHSNASTVTSNRTGAEGDANGVACFAFLAAGEDYDVTATSGTLSGTTVVHITAGSTSSATLNI